MEGKIKVVLKDGDPIKFKEMMCAFFTCCECGLTHLFILGTEGKLCVASVYRDNNLTAIARLELKEKKAKEKKIFLHSVDDFKEKVHIDDVDAKEIIKKNKELEKRADQAIKAAEKEQSSTKEGWDLCSNCQVKRVAPWNKKGICSDCQRPPAKRKYKTRKKPEEEI